MLTDSLLYHVYTYDIYNDIHKDKHLFDFFNYDKSGPMYGITNTKKTKAL